MKLVNSSIDFELVGFYFVIEVSLHNFIILYIKIDLNNNVKCGRRDMPFEHVKLGGQTDRVGVRFHTM